MSARITTTELERARKWARVYDRKEFLRGNFLLLTTQVEQSGQKPHDILFKCGFWEDVEQDGLYNYCTGSRAKLDQNPFFFHFLTLSANVIF